MYPFTADFVRMFATFNAALVMPGSCDGLAAGEVLLTCRHHWSCENINRVRVIHLMRDTYSTPSGCPVQSAFGVDIKAVKSPFSATHSLHHTQQDPPLLQDFFSHRRRIPQVPPNREKQARLTAPADRRPPVRQYPDVCGSHRRPTNTSWQLNTSGLIRSVRTQMVCVNQSSEITTELQLELWKAVRR